jgi:hypothetical protein
VIRPRLKRHSQVFTFLGASLVFATFLCKEVLLERQKSSVEQADNAQRTFLVLKRLDLLNARMAAIEGADIIFPGHESQDINLEVEAQELQAFRGASDVDAYMESLEDLINEVQKTSIDKKSLKAIDIQRNNMRSDLHNLTDPEDVRASLEIVKPEVSKIVSEQYSIEHQARVFSEKLLRRLRDEKQKAEEKQEAIRNWSYALYSTGFLLGLFAQLIGVEAARSE